LHKGEINVNSLTIDQLREVNGGLKMPEFLGGAALVLEGLAIAVAPEVTIPVVLVAGAISGVGGSMMLNSAGG
jgi:hypothetical protein